MRMHDGETSPLPRPLRVLRDILCVIALIWPALLNGQPFFFPDTTSYVRAADIAVYMASGKRLSTEWTDHYRESLSRLQTHAGATDANDKTTDTTDQIGGGNDIGSGKVMSGRSPYFGAALYLGYLASDFWLVVLAYGVLTYLLILLSLRSYGLDRPGFRLATVAFVAVLTTAPFYDSYLLADALAGQGILAFLLLAFKREASGRWERLFLLALLVASAISHLTHMVILFAMGVAAAGLGLLGVFPRRRSRYALGLAIAIAAVGLVSTTITSAVVKQAFGAPPQLVPLLTARFIGDGPGRWYVRDHCHGQFAVCAFADHIPDTSLDFLWSHEPGKGVFLLADAPARAAMSREDTAFAFAVWRTYPAAQTGMILYNMALQAALFDSNWLNYGCWQDADCWQAVPERLRNAMRDTLSGRNLWPTRAITAVHYLAVIGALPILGLFACLYWRRYDDAEEPDATVWQSDVTGWIALLVVALLANAFLGGSISDPQSRYQGRIVWLIPFSAFLYAALWYRTRATARAVSCPA